MDQKVKQFACCERIGSVSFEEVGMGELEGDGPVCVCEVVDLCGSDDEDTLLPFLLVQSCATLSVSSVKRRHVADGAQHHPWRQRGEQFETVAEDLAYIRRR